ncbi:MAG: hypothetical protein ACYC6K_12480 [Bellilinea sp.]
MTIADVITAISVAIAAIAFVTGINAWKREFVGKRHIELAENVLALFYEAQDAIREIRSPFSYVGEGATRKHSEYEGEEEAKLLDQAYVVFERYQKREKLFSELRSMKYRFMATFGSDAGESFDDLTRIMNEIFSSAQILGTYYWKRQGQVDMSEDELQVHLEQMHKHEAIFWSMGEKNDKILPRVATAVEKIETIAKEAAKMKFA